MLLQHLAVELQASLKQNLALRLRHPTIDPARENISPGSSILETELMSSLIEQVHEHNIYQCQGLHQPNHLVLTHSHWVPKKVQRLTSGMAKSTSIRKWQLICPSFDIGMMIAREKPIRKTTHSLIWRHPLECMDCALASSSRAARSEFLGQPSAASRICVFFWRSEVILHALQFKVAAKFP